MATTPTDDEHSSAQQRDPPQYLGAQGLATLLGLSLHTVKKYASAQPDKLPPRVEWTTKQLWEARIAHEWLTKRDGHLSIEQQVEKAREAGAALAKQHDDSETPQSQKHKPRVGRPRGSGKRRTVA